MLPWIIENGLAGDITYAVRVQLPTIKIYSYANLDQKKFSARICCAFSWLFMFVVSLFLEAATDRFNDFSKTVQRAQLKNQLKSTAQKRSCCCCNCNPHSH